MVLSLPLVPKVLNWPVLKRPVQMGTTQVADHTFSVTELRFTFGGVRVEAEASFRGGWGAVAPPKEKEKKKEKKEKREKKRKKEKKKEGNYE